MDKHHVSAGFGARILGARIKTHQVARNKFEVFKGERGGTVRLFCALLLQQIACLLRPPINRIVKGEGVEPKIVLGLHGDRDLLNRAGVVFAGRPGDAHHRGIHFARFDEEVVR